MLTPKIIVFVYWVLLAMVVIGGFAAMFARGFGFGSFLMGLFAIVVGAVAVRISCELLIVLFKMNEALQELRNK